MNAFLFIYLSFATVLKSDLSGVWLSANHDVKIEIFFDKTEYKGKVIWISKDSDSNLREDDYVFTDLVRNEDSIYKGFFVYQDKMINCSLEKLTNNKLQVKMTKGIWSNTVVWTRVEN